MNDNTLMAAEARFIELWEFTDQATERMPARDRAFTFYLLGIAEGARQSLETVRRQVAAWAKEERRP
jgi:hypothetical protein